MYLTISKHKLKEGLNYIPEWDCWIFRESDNFSVIENRCKHEGTRFVRDKNCSENLFCPKHKWILDARSGSYVNPYGLVHTNRDFKIQNIGSDEVILSRSHSESEVENVNSNKSQLSQRELTLRFINHACCVVNAGETSLTTDPWILGPSFCTGWFLQKPTSEFSVRSILDSKILYISHSHPDHLNLYSLFFLKNLGWNPIVILPKFQNRDICKPVLESIGYHNFYEISNQDKLQISEDLRLRIFTDVSGRNDSSLEIDYKGLKILNLVDTPNPDLPADYTADVVLAPFAGGASGFPVCWTDMYSMEKVQDIVKINKYHSLTTFINKATSLNARLVIPFAGYFRTPLDCDKTVDLINKKNSPDDACRTARGKFPDCQFIVPYQDQIFDLSKIDTEDLTIDHCGIDESSDPKCLQGSPVRLGPLLETPEDYLDFLYENYNNFTKREVVEFLEKQHYRSDLVVQIQSYDINFANCYWECVWDFRFNHELSEFDEQVGSHTNTIRTLKMRVRNFAIGMTIRNSLPWEEFTIGFQARFSRNPDTYNFDFWDYFQNRFFPTRVPCLDLYSKINAMGVNKTA